MQSDAGIVESKSKEWWRDETYIEIAHDDVSEAGRRLIFVCLLRNDPIQTEPLNFFSSLFRASNFSKTLLSTCLPACLLR